MRVSVIEGDYPVPDNLGFAWATILRNMAKAVPKVNKSALKSAMRSIRKNAQGQEIPAGSPAQPGETTSEVPVSGFGKFRAPKMKIRAPKIKIRAPRAPRINAPRIPTKSLMNNASSLAKTAIDPLNLRTAIPSALNQVTSAIPSVMETVNSMNPMSQVMQMAPQLLSTAKDIVTDPGVQSMAMQAVKMANPELMALDMAPGLTQAVTPMLSEELSQENLSDLTQASQVMTSDDTANAFNRMASLSTDLVRQAILEGDFGYVRNPKYKTVKQLLSTSEGKALWNNTKEGQIVKGTNLKKNTKKLPASKRPLIKKSALQKKTPESVSKPEYKNVSTLPVLPGTSVNILNKAKERDERESILKPALFDTYNQQGSTFTVKEKKIENSSLPDWFNVQNGVIAVVVIIALFFLKDILLKGK